MKLKVCGRGEIAEFENRGFTHMISIGDSDDFFDGLRLPEIAADDHLILRFTDTNDPSHPDAPQLGHLKNLFAWLAQAEGIEGLLVHCAGGISRSPAIALLSLCHLEPEVVPRDHMDRVAAAAECPYIWPNHVVLSLGEQVLDRRGEFVKAVDEWGAKNRVDPLQFF